jgi:3-oxoacyl-[acyl-carrier-protein] synthase II
MEIRHTYQVDDRERYRSDESGHAVAFALAAAKDALANVQPHELPAPERIGVILGNAMGDDITELRRLAGEPLPSNTFPFGIACELANHFRFCGSVMDVSAACSAGLFAVAIAAELIEDGLLDMAIAGGTEAVSRTAMGCFNRLGALDPVTCRPFDAGRRGTVMGEGAGILVLQSSDRTKRDRAQEFCTISGSGWSCDAHHSTNPCPSAGQAIRAAQIAASNANIGANEIGLIVAHGTGTPQNDRVESKLIDEMFCAGAQPLLYSPKGALGHSGGAAGAFQAIIGAVAIKTESVPPNANLNVIDPSMSGRIPIDMCQVLLKHVLVNAYAFGGNNISVILSKP